MTRATAPLYDEKPVDRRGGQGDPNEKHGAALTIKYNPRLVAAVNAGAVPPCLFVARSRDDCPGFDFTKSPSFYFMKDGRVVHRFVGWDSENWRRDFDAGLAAIGLEPGAGRPPRVGGGPIQPATAMQASRDAVAEPAAAAPQDKTTP